jgi:hypothetical protein
LDPRLPPDVEQPRERSLFPEFPNARAEEAADLGPAGRNNPAECGQYGSDIALPRKTRDRVSGDVELEHGERAAGPHDSGELLQGRGQVVDVAKKVRERERVEGRVLEGQRLRLRLPELDPIRKPGALHATASRCEHLRALVDPHHPAAGPADELECDGRGTRGHVEHRVGGLGRDARDEERPPAWILSEAEEAGVAVVALGQGGKEVARRAVSLREGDGHEDIVAPMPLEEELASAGDAAQAHAEDGEELVAVIPTEPATGALVYLCGYARGEKQSWLALDSNGRPIADRVLVRDAVSIAALCELAEESAGGGDLGGLRAQLVELRLTENPAGVEDAEVAAAALQEAIRKPPRVASVEYLDAIGLAAARLERALGEVSGSPFAEAMKVGVAAAEELADDVERSYKLPLG